MTFERQWHKQGFPYDKEMAECVAKGINAAPNVTGVHKAKAEQKPDGTWGVTWEKR